MIGRLNRSLTGLLRRFVGSLPDDQREWGEAMLAEVGSVPAGRERLSWLCGALWRTARVALVFRRAVFSLAMIGAAIAVIRYGWNGDWDNPARPVNRIFLICIVVVLLALPLLLRRTRTFGPVSGNRPATVLRIGGYLAVCTLLPIVIGVGHFAGNRLASCGECSPAEQEQWRTERVGDALSGSLTIFCLITAYAIGILWITGRRVAISSTALAIGGGCAVVGGLAVYGLSPTGGTWDVGHGWLDTALGLAVVAVILGMPAVAGGWAEARSGHSEDRLLQGMFAGTVVGALGTLLIAVLTIPTMLIFPSRVPLKWANPSPSVPHGTVFEIQMSVGDAAVGYEVWLLLAPLLGAVLGLVGAQVSASLRRRTTAIRLPSMPPMAEAGPE